MLRAKLGAAAQAVKTFFTGGKAQVDPAVAAMENLRVSPKKADLQLHY
jgi:hypothetical protein